MVAAVGVAGEIEGLISVDGLACVCFTLLNDDGALREWTWQVRD